MRLVKHVIPVAFLAAFFCGGLTATSLVSTAAAQSEDEEAVGEPDVPTVVANPNATKLGVGARVRYVFMPQAVLNLFLDHSTSMNSVGFGLEVVRRKGDFDIAFGLEYDSIAPENGLYLESGDDPGANCRVTTECPDKTEFENFALLGLDATFLWHSKISDTVQFRYGAGIGVGLVLGSLYQTDTACPAGTTVDDLDDPNQCPVAPGAARVKSDDVPPVVPIVNVQLGARIKLAPQLTINIETGFRNMFFLGLGTDYVF